MNKYKKTWCFLLLAFFQSAYAEELNAPDNSGSDVVSEIAPNRIISEDDYLGEVPIVLSVSRLSQPIADAPSAVTVIDRDTIRAAGIVDLPEIFRLVPGMYVGANAGFVHNTNHVVSYHGMTNAYAGAMQVLINGRSVYSPLYGGVQWSELPIAIADIERIEVTRGPNAASYGANSYFGVINIITQHPSQAPSNSVISTFGNGRNEVLYRHAGGANDFTYRATVGYRDDDGLDNRNDYKRTSFFNTQAEYRVNATNTLEFEFGLADGVREEGNINKDKLVFLPRTKGINNRYELVRWRNNLSEGSDFSLQAYHSYDKSDDVTTSTNLRPVFAEIVTKQALSKIPSPTPAQIALANAAGLNAAATLVSDTITIQNPVEMERYDIEAQHNFAIGKTVRVVWGGSVRQDSMKAPFYLGTGETDYFNLQRLFGHVEWRAHDRVVVNMGEMLEHNDFTGTDFSPRASLNIKIAPEHTIRFGVSTALRTPSYLEEKFNRSFIIPRVAPNPSILFQYGADKGNLDPEKIISREIGYLGQFGALSLDARLYHDTISNLISDYKRNDFVTPKGLILLTPAGSGVGDFTNVGKNTVNGFELQAKWRISPDTNLLINYADENVKQDIPTSIPNYQTYIRNGDQAPGNTVSALISHRFNAQWDGSFAYYQTSQTEALGDGQPVGIIRRADIRLARKFNIGAKNGEVSLAVENLFNNHYQEFAQYNTLKRRAFVGVSLDF